MKIDQGTVRYYICTVCGEKHDDWRGNCEYCSATEYWVYVDDLALFEPGPKEDILREEKYSQ